MQAAYRRPFRIAVANSPKAAISRAKALISKAIFKMVINFSSWFVGLDWPDVDEAKAGVRG